jgi:TonB family protein
MSLSRQAEVRVLRWEDTFAPSMKGPYLLAIAFHACLFIWNPTIMRSSDMKPITDYMQIKFEDKLPEITKPEVKKAVPKPVHKKVVKKAKKSGLSMAKKPEAVSVTRRAPAKAKAAPKPFVSKINIPKFVPRDSDEIIAASPAPGISAPAPRRMQQAANPGPVLRGKTRGVRAQDIHFELKDRGTLIGSAGQKIVAIPVGEESGDTPFLPPAAVLKQAPRGLKTVQGYRNTPGMGTGSGELAGKNKGGYFGVVKAETYVEGTISGTGGDGKGHATVTGKGFEIGGPVGDRKIIHRRLPEYPVWAEEKGISAMVRIYFTVRPDGTIRANLRIERSSGYTELDQLAKEALMNWKFSPTSARSTDNEAWGVITFKFTLA